MNKIYRLVWNKSLNLWTVVSENARGVTKKRNVSANTDLQASTLVQQNLEKSKKYQPITTVLALTISSVLWSTGAFAATNTGGGSVTNSNGSSMAISPTASQCGTGSGEAFVNGNSGLAVGCGNNISGTDASFEQGLNNRRGTGSNNYPTGATNALSTATAVGRNNEIKGRGGATVVGAHNKSDSGFHNVIVGQGNNTIGAGYNVALGIGNGINGSSSISVGVDNAVSGNTAMGLGRGVISRADFGIAQGNTATVAQGATSGIAMGNSATTNGARGIAIGSSTGTDGQYDASTAPTANGADSIAVGTGAKGTGEGSTAVGRQAAATGSSSAALGDKAKADNNGDLALGTNAQASGVTRDGVTYSAAAVGRNALAQGEDALAVGNTAKATANYAGAVGNFAEATGQNSIAVGNATKASGNFSSAFGNFAEASGIQSTTSGNRSKASGDFSSAYGNLAEASGRQATAIGNDSKATAQRSSALGNGALASGTDSLATGSNAQATGASSVASGAGAKAQGDNDIAMGLNAATASGGSNNIAVGNGVTTGATGQNVAMGSGTTTANSASSTGGAVAIGRDQKATGDGAVALGDPNTANGNGTVALGRNNTAAGDTAGNTAANGAVAIGNENKAIGQGAVALGNASTAAAAGAVALGDTANAKASNGVALGSNAVANNANDVALGSGSQTSTATGTAYRTGTAAPSSVVSVGTAGNERRIQNVSAGAADTDAVNVSQLRSVQDGVDQLGQTTAGALGGGAAYDPNTGAISNPTYTVNGNNVNNVGDAITELDKGWNLQSNGANSAAVKAGDTVDIGTADGEENLQVAKDGNNIKYSLNRDLKVDSVTAGDTVINNDGMTIAGGPSVTKSGIDAAGNKITGVAAGTDGTDAVNKDQLDQASNDLTNKGFGLTAQDGTTVQKKLGEAIDVVGADENITTKVQDGKVAIELAKDLNVNSVTAGDTVMNTDGVTIAGGPSMTKSGIDAAGNKITNVADGDINPDSKDAINGSQLAKNAQSVSDALGGGSTVNPDGTVSAPNYTVNGNNVSNVGDAISELDKGWNLQSNGANSGAVKAGDTVDIGTADGEENLQVAKEGNNIKYSLNRDLKVDSVTAGDTVINNDGMTIAGGPSVTKSGIDAAGTTISNVGPGVAGTDAVNVDQLNKASQDLTDKGFGLTAQDGTTVQKKLGEAVDVVGADENITTKVQDGKVAIELAKDLNVNSVTAGDTVMNTDGVTIAGGPSMTKSGIDAAGNKITNVADGDINPDSKDAINGSQLAKNAQSVSDALGGGSTVNPDGTVSAPNYTVNGNNVSNVGDAITELDKGWNLQSNGANSGAVKAGDTVDIGTADGEENLQVAKDGNNIKYSLNRDLNVDSVTAGDTVINNDGMTIAGGPSISKSGIDAAGNKITNVADGDINPDSKDAINGSQLAKNAQSVSDALGGGSTVNPDGTVSAPTYTVNGNNVNNVGAAISELDKGWNLQSNGANSGAVKAGDTVDIGTADGEENLQVAKEGNNIKYSLNRDLKVDSVTAGDTVINNDGMTIAGGPSVTKSGIDAAGNKITNVADGEVAAGSKDAVNGGQLHDTTDSVGNILGGGVTNEGGKLNGPFTVNDKGYDTVADAIKAETAAAKTEVEAGKNMTVNSTTGADGQTVYTVATADDVEFNSVKVGDVNIDGATGKISGVTDGTVAAGSTEAINGSQLHNTAQSTADALGGGSTVNPDGTVSAPNYSVNGTSLNNVGDAITELDKGWNLQSNGANSGAVKAGDTVDIGTADGEENLQVAKDGNNIKYSLNRDLKVDSVTAGDTVINNDGMSIAGGPNMTKSGIDAAGNKITNVADGDINPDSKDAINGSQLAKNSQSVSDALGGGSTVNPDGTVSAPNYSVNGTSLNNVGDAITELDKGWNLQSNGANGGAVKAGDTVDIGTADGEENLQVAKDGNNIKYSLNRDLKVDSVTAGDSVLNNDGMTIAGGPSVTKSGIDAAGNKITGVADGDINPDSKDAINGSQLAKNAQSVSDALGGGSTVNADGTVSAPNYSVNGTSLNNVGDAITELDKGWNLQSNGANSGAVKAGDTVDIGTADGEENLQVAKDGNNIKYSLNRDLKVDSVTAGDSVLNNDGLTIAGGPSVTKSGIDAAGNKITNVAAGTDGTDAVNMDQLKTSAAGAKTEVEAGKNMTVDSTTGADGQTIYTVATADDVEFNSVKVGDVNIDGATGKISGVTDGTVAAGSTEAVNGSQLHGTAQSVSDALGGGSTVNPDGTVTAPNYTVNGNNVSNVGDAITELDKGWNLQSNGANSGAVKAGDTVDIGTADGEENLQVSKDGNNIKYSLNRDLNVDSVTAGDTVINNDGMTIAGGPSVTKSGIDAAGNKITNVADGEVAAGSKDAVNGGQLHDTTDSVGNILGGGVTNEGGKLNGPFTVNDKGYDTVADAIKAETAAAKTEVEAGKNMTVDSTTGADGQTIYTVATADDVEFNSVKVGDVNIDGSTGKISGVTDGTVAAGSTEAVNGSQLHGVADSVKNSIGGETILNPDGSVTTANVGNTGKDNIHDAIDSVRSAAVEAKTTVTQGDNMLVTESKNADGSTNYEVATARDVNFDSVQVGDVKIDSATGKITGVADGDINPDSKDAINGSQLAKNAQSVSDALGGGSTVNPDGTVTAPNYSVNGTNLNNVGDAITELDKGWNLQSNGANSGAVKAGDTVDIGTADGEENLQVAKDGNNIKYSLNRDLKVDSVTAGDTVINNDGMTIAGGPSVTKSGIDVAGNKISNVAAGTDGTDAVNVDQLKASAAGAKTEVEAGKNMTVDSTTGADGQTIYTVATADDVEFNSVKVGDVNIDGATGKISGVADGTVAAGSTEAVNGSQLHGTAQSVSDALGGGSTVNPDGTVSAPNYTVNGNNVSNVGDAITELDKGWNLQSNGANSGAVKAGDTVDIGTADGEQNLQVAKEGNNIKYSLNRDLNVDSVTAGNTRLDNTGVEVKDPVGNSTSIVAGGTIVKDAQGNTNAQTAAGSTIKNAQGDTTLVNSTGLAFTDASGAPVGPSVSRTGIDAGGLKVTNVADGEVAAGSKDAVNGGQLHDTADSVGNILGGGVTNEGGKLNGPFTVNDKGYDTVADAIKAETAAAKTEVEAGKNMTVDSTTGADGQTIYTVATADDVEFNSVKVGNVNIDGATGKISGVTDGTVAAGSTEAVNGSQLHGVADSVKNSIGGETSLNPDGSVTTANVGNTGKDNIHDAIDSVRGAAVEAKTTVTQGDNMLVTESKNADGSTNYEVATARDVNFDSVQVGDVKIDSATGKITGVADGDINPDSKDAINGSQLAKNAQSVSDALGGGSTVNPDGTVTAPNYTVNGNKLNNVGDAITELDKGWNLQSNGANSGAVKAGDTVDIGTADGEENLQVAKDGNNIKYSLNHDLKVDSVTAGDSVLNKDGLTIAGGPSVTKAGINAGNKKITGVAAGAVRPDSTEAINGSQLNAQGEGVKNIIGGNTQYDPNTGKYTNPDVGGTGKDNINDAIGAVGAAAKAAKTTVTEGDNMVVTESKNADGSTSYEVATAKDVKFDSVTSTDDEGNETVLTAKGTQVKDGEGNEAEYGAKGVTLKDQDGNGTVLNSTGLGFVDPMGNNIGPSITAKGIDAGNTVITGVAAGRVAADSQDAINGSQLKGVSDSVAKSIGGNTTVNPDGTMNTSNIGGTGKDNINDAIGAIGDAAKEAKSSVSEGKNIVVKESKNADGSTDYQVSTSPDLDVDSVTAGGTKVDGDGLHIDGGPSVTKDGIDAGDKKVTGVADGEVAKDSKDAINGGQLKDVSDSVAGAIGGNTTVNPDGTINTSNIGGTGHDNINDAIGAVGDAAKAAGEAAKAAKSSVSNTDNNITVNKTTKADGSTDYEVGLAKDISVDSVTAKDVNADRVTVAGDQGSTTVTGGGISITGPKGEQGPSMTTDGINAGGKKVTGVADGAIAKGSQEGINGGQLHQSYQDVGAALGGGAGYDPDKGWKGPSYNVAGGNYNNVGDALGALDNRVTNLGDQLQQAFYDTNKRMGKLEDKMSAGIAATAALENAPFVAGKLTMAAGAAYYNDQSAIGVTFRRTADNGRWSLTTGAAMGSEGNSPLVRVGVSTVID
ncbi:hep_Hag family protein [Acinetobacter baumannii 1437282]|nr:hep_Hag family protein [Acinetobacter baumannii 1437282]